MALNEIKAIGQAEAELDAEAGAEKLAEAQLTREDLDANADSVDVNDKALFDAIAVAKTSLQELMRGRGFSVEANKDDLLQALAEATGEETPGEETLWLAEQLGIADMLNVEELLETEDLVSDFKNLLTEAGLLSANFSEAEFEALSTALNSGELTPDLEAQREAIAEAMELTGTFALTLNLQENARTNSLYQLLSPAAQIALLKDVQTNGGSTVEEQQAYIQQKLNGLESDAIATAPPNQTAQRYLALINNAGEPLKSELLNNGDFTGIKERLEAKLETVLASLQTGTELSAEAQQLGSLLGTTDLFTRVQRAYTSEGEEREGAIASALEALNNATTPTIAQFETALGSTSLSEIMEQTRGFLENEQNVEALIANVPETELNTAEFEEWLTALKNGETSMEYMDYLTTVIMPSKEGMAALGLQMRLALGPIIAMIKDFMAQFEGINGDSDAAEERAAAAEAVAGQRRAALETAMGMEPGDLDARDVASGAAAGLNSMGVNINGLMDENGQVDATLLGRYAAAQTIENPLDALNQAVAKISERADGAAILAIGLKPETLMTLSDDSLEGKVTLSGAAPNQILTINGTDVPMANADARDAAILAATQPVVEAAEAVEAAQVAEVAAQAEAAQTAAEDAEKAAQREQFVANVVNVIKESGVIAFNENTDSWFGSDYEADDLEIDNDDNHRGFILRDDKIYVDIDGSFWNLSDQQDDDLVVFDGDYSTTGFDSAEEAVNYLRNESGLVNKNLADL